MVVGIEGFVGRAFDSGGGGAKGTNFLRYICLQSQGSCAVTSGRNPRKHSGMGKLAVPAQWAA